MLKKNTINILISFLVLQKSYNLNSSHNFSMAGEKKSMWSWEKCFSKITPWYCKRSPKYYILFQESYFGDSGWGIYMVLLALKCGRNKWFWCHSPHMHTHKMFLCSSPSLPYTKSRCYHLEARRKYSAL